MHYRVEGSGQPVILVHGMAASLHTWRFTFPELIANGYRVYAVDLPGHGESARPNGPPEQHIDAIYDSFKDWITELGVQEPFFLVAHSMGAYLSCRFAIQHPAAVQGLVLIDPYISYDQLTIWLRIPMARPRLSATLLDRAPLWVVESVVRLNRHLAERIPPGMQQQVALDYKRAAAEILFSAARIEDITPQLDQITAATMVIWGERDLTLAPQSFPQLLEVFPNATGHTLRECGHAPHLTHPSEFNQTLIRFLQNHSVESGQPDGRGDQRFKT